MAPYAYTQHGPAPSMIDNSLSVVEKILSNTRNPQVASPNQPHTYNDKFALAEFLTTILVTSLLNALDNLGLTKSALLQLGGAVEDKKKSVTLRFSAKHNCQFLKEEKVEMESPTEVIEKKEGPAKIFSSTRKVVTKVKQYHWKIDIEYMIHAFCGTDSDPDGKQSIVLQSKTLSCQVITQGEKKPPTLYPSLPQGPKDIPLTWLFKHIDRNTLNAKFSIDRALESCRTPKHNQEIKEAASFLLKFKNWCNDVKHYFTKKDSEVSNCMQPDPNQTSLANITSENRIFVPVLPIFETETDDSNTPSTPRSPILSAEDISLFLSEQCRSMTEQIDSISSKFSSQQVMTSAEATIVLILDHIEHVLIKWTDGVEHIEQMLYTQLYDAIGKEVDRKDLEEFVRFHNQRLFADTYAPEPFCYAIRRPNHYPDGVISIEQNGGDNIETFTRKLENKNNEYPVYIPINSATSVEFKGDMYLHAWLLQRFQESPSFQLASRARQFSSFVLLIGNLSGPDTFNPEHGIILQNKDELLIPLLLNEMPSAKEFKDAIESLSPEQQRFAKSFRSMKLSSSVFGVCVIQLKPQLELLLGLPMTSLTKEIQLTQDLLKLFIDYQIPSDLLSYDGTDELTPGEKVDKVKHYVKNVMDMIENTKREELEVSKKEAEERFYSSSLQNLRVQQMATSAVEGSRSRCEDSLCEEVRGSGSNLSLRAKKFSKGKQSLKSVRSFRRKSKMNVQMNFEISDSYGDPFAAMPGSAPKSMACAPPSMAGRASQMEHIQVGSREDGQNKAISTKKDTANNAAFVRKSTSNLNNVGIDLTTVPKHLDILFERFSADETYGGALRSTTIKTGQYWKKSFKPNLLTKEKQKSMNADEQKSERNRAFDLLDALSQSGALPMCDAELHVVVASSHCFEKSVVDTVVQDNINPIEKIERSNLLVAKVVHDVQVAELLHDQEELTRIIGSSPLLVEDTPFLKK